MSNSSEFDQKLDAGVQAHEAMTNQTPDETTFAYMKAIVRDEINEQNK